MMRRYLVFVGDCYYADGGWKDFVGTRDTCDQAKELADLRNTELDHNGVASKPDSFWDLHWAQIVDGLTMQIVEVRGKNLSDTDSSERPWPWRPSK